MGKDALKHSKPSDKLAVDGGKSSKKSKKLSKMDSKELVEMKASKKKKKEGSATASDDVDVSFAELEDILGGSKPAKSTKSGKGGANDDDEDILANIFQQVKQNKEQNKKEKDSSSSSSSSGKTSKGTTSSGDDNGVWGVIKGARNFIISPEAPLERIDKESGFPVYKAHLLKVGEGGGTPLCPFDCDCCF